MITIDKSRDVIVIDGKEHNIYSPESFHALEKIWSGIAWANNYSYQFSWMGRPIIQLPEDMVRTQEVIYKLKPTCIIETGVAHGGSLIFYASLLKIFGGGKIIGVDIEIRPHNRSAIESHELSSMIDLIVGSSTDHVIIKQVASKIKPDDRVLVLLDSDHSAGHVYNELVKYAPFVTKGSYIVATDGIMKDLVGAPKSKPDWGTNNPQDAVEKFLKENKDFVLEYPEFVFNESPVKKVMTHWPNAWLKRV